MTNHNVYFGNCYDLKNNFTKCGKTSNFINRKGILQTSYPLNKFKPKMLIICSNEEESTEIETLIHSEYYEYNTMNRNDYDSTSNEWFDYNFTYNEVKKLLEINFYNNIILIGDQLNEYISKLERKIYNKEKYINEMKLLKAKRINKCKPNDIQYNVLKKIGTFYKENNIGKFIAACGVGKTLTSLFISKIMKFKSIIIGVPYTNLLEQWENEIKKVYPELSILIVGGNGTTEYDKIKNFIKLNTDRIIITTYSSSNIIQKISDIF